MNPCCISRAVVYNQFVIDRTTILVNTKEEVIKVALFHK